MLEPEGLHLGLILIYLRNKSWKKDEEAELAWVCICPPAQAQQCLQAPTISCLNSAWAEGLPKSRQRHVTHNSVLLLSLKNKVSGQSPKYML